MGILLNWALFGALTIQLYIYAQYFTDDKKVSTYYFEIYLLLTEVIVKSG